MESIRCPHCERTWDAVDLSLASRPATMILDDHVRKFCPGQPPATRRVRRKEAMSAA